MLSFELFPEYDCSTCTAHQKLQRGCETDAPFPHEIDGEEVLRCPRRPLLDEGELYSDLFWLYQSAKEGHLPESSSLGLYGQPNRFLQMSRIIDSAFAEIREEKEDQARRKRAAMQKAGMK